MHVFRFWKHCGTPKGEKMFSRSNLLLQQLVIKNASRNISLKKIQSVKPIFTRNLAWFRGQGVKETFGMWIKQYFRMT